MTLKPYKYIKLMKILLCILAFLGLTSNLSGQTAQDIVVKRKSNDMIVDIDTLVGIKNKRIMFEVDTLYIINRLGVAEFVRCANELNKMKNLSGSLGELTSNVFTIQTNVNSMYSNMQSVTSFINGYEKETKLKLDLLKADNIQLTQNMQSITGELEEARQKIKAERWKNVGTKVIWGAGGITVGGLLFSGLLLMK